jgi:hypothetical protein
MRGPRYLIGQLGCYGDCLYATTVARQIKTDTPDAHVTWAVAARYRSVLDGNPDVDQVWELPIHTKHFSRDEWEQFTREAEARRQAGEFDEIFYTQVIGPHLETFTTTLRRAVFAIVGRPITTDVRPIVILSDDERARVAIFAEAHALATFKHVVIVESAPGSGQSTFGSAFASEVVNQVLARRTDVCFVFSSTARTASRSRHVVDASELSYRENLELTRHATLVVGCSSGITWLSTAQHARRLPLLQLIDASSPIYCGVDFDFVLQGLDNSEVIELVKFDVARVVACLDTIFDEGPRAARARFHQPYVPSYVNLKWAAQALVERGDSLFSVMRFARRFVRDNAVVGNRVRYSAARLAMSLIVHRARVARTGPLRALRAMARPAIRLARWSGT